MKASKLCSQLLATALAFSAAALAEQSARQLTVQVSGTAPSAGQLIVSVFSSPANYLKQPISEQKLPVDATGLTELTFEKLDAGTYAVSVVYDENENGELDTGRLGIPTEKFGFSNSARGRFGPPSFEKAAFMFSDSATIVIRLDDAVDKATINKATK